MIKWMVGLLLIALLATGGPGMFPAVEAAPPRIGPKGPGVPGLPGQDRPGRFQAKTYLIVSAIGTVDLLVTDPQGRRVGVYSGTVVQEITGTYYYGPHEVFEGIEMESMSIPDPLTGTYSIRVTGTDEGGFNLMAMVSSSWGGELLLHDIQGITPGQVYEYSVAGMPQPLAERTVAYALQVMKNLGEWSSVLRLQSVAEAPMRAMVTTYAGWGGVELYASGAETIIAHGVLPISFTEKVALPGGFRGAAMVETEERLGVALALTAETGDGRRMATEGVVQGASALYVPYLPSGEILSVLHVQNASDEQATVRLTCRDLDGSLVPSATVTLTVSPRATIRSTLQAGLPAGFQGSAIVESLAGQPLVGAVFLGSLAGEAALYSVPSTPSPALFVPQVRKEAGGISTTLQVQNTAALPTQVVVRYYGPDGHPLEGADTRLPIPAHGAARLAPPGRAGTAAPTGGR
jgi:hypothetical protein